MSKLVVILSPLMKHEEVQAKLETLLAGKRTVVVSADPFFEDADITLVPFETDLSRRLSGKTLDQLLDQKQLLVQTHDQGVVGEHMSEIMMDENVDSAQASRVSAQAFGLIGFAKNIAKVNENFVIGTELEYDFGEAVAIKEWIERREEEAAQQAAVAEVKVNEPTPVSVEETVSQIPSDTKPELHVGDENVKEALVSEQPEIVAKETQTAEDEVALSPLEEARKIAAQEPEVQPIPDQGQVIENVVKGAETIVEQAYTAAVKSEADPAVVEFDERIQEQTKAATPELKETVEPASYATTPVETKQDEDLFAFDPIQAAFNNSVNQSKTVEVDKPTESKKQEKKDVKQIIGRLPDYPKVNVTVEILKHPLTLKEDGTNPGTPKFYDWAGDTDVLTASLALVDDKMEEAEIKKRRPDLTDLELKALACMDDRIGSALTLERMFNEGSKWGQLLRTETRTAPLITVIKSPNYGDHRYVGDDAVPLIANRMKIGVTVGTFLPHSGLYFLIISPSDQEVIDTLSVVNTQRVEMLRSSSGILLGNSNFYLNRQIIDLFLNNVTDCSLAAFNRETMYSLIDDRDVDIMAAALQTSICPDGYDYHQVCGLVREDDPDEVCDGSDDFLLNLGRAVFVDNTRLNEYQRNIATSGITKRSIKEIEEYQAQGYLGWSHPYEITEGIQFLYKPAKAHQQIEAGEKWIDEISKVVDRILAFKQDENERNMMIEQRINLARMREFSHWIEDIIIDGNPLQDRNKINQLLDRLGRNPEVVNKVGETISEFQRKSVVAMVAIPRVPCRTCQKTNQDSIDISPYLIPQDAVSRFFTLALQRLS